MLNNQDWSQDSISVIVLPAGAEGQGILEVARKWTAAWLLSPALWVCAEDVPKESSGPPEIKALVLGRGDLGGEDDAEVELFWKLGEGYRPRVRLIAIRMLQDDIDQIVTSKAIQQIAEYLDGSLPTRVLTDRDTNPDQMYTEFLRLNLIVDAAEVSGLNAADVFQEEWEANIVASPEDRSTPFSPDAPPIHPRNFNDLTHNTIGETQARAARYYGWAMAHIASAAGLWSGLSQSVYDLMPPKPSVAHSMCLVQRICVRGVVTDGLAISLASSAMTLALESSEEASMAIRTALQSHKIETIPDAETASRASEMVEASLVGLRDLGFGYREFDDPGPYRVPKTSLGKRLKLIGKLGGKASVKTPKFMMDLTLQRLSRSLTIEDGDAIVESASTWNPGLPTIDDGVYEIPLAPAPNTAGLKPNPQVWRDLRDLVFAALDASPNSEMATQILSGSASENTMVFPSVTDVLPDPNHPWTHAELNRVDMPILPIIDWMDSTRAQATLEMLNGLYEQRVPSVHEMRTRANEKRFELVEAKRDLERLQRSIAALEADHTEAKYWLDEMTQDHPHTSIRSTTSDLSQKVGRE